MAWTEGLLQVQGAVAGVLRPPAGRLPSRGVWRLNLMLGDGADPSWAESVRDSSGDVRWFEKVGDGVEPALVLREAYEEAVAGVSPEEAGYARDTVVSALSAGTAMGVRGLARGSYLGDRAIMERSCQGAAVAWGVIPSRVGEPALYWLTAQ